jgi:hypothetical protein
MHGQLSSPCRRMLLLRGSMAGNRDGRLMFGGHKAGTGGQVTGGGFKVDWNVGNVGSGEMPVCCVVVVVVLGAVVVVIEAVVGDTVVVVIDAVVDGADVVVTTAVEGDGVVVVKVGAGAPVVVRVGMGTAVEDKVGNGGSVVVNVESVGNGGNVVVVVDKIVNGVVPVSVTVVLGVVVVVGMVVVVVGIVVVVVGMVVVGMGVGARRRLNQVTQSSENNLQPTLTRGHSSWRHGGSRKSDGPRCGRRKRRTRR